MAVVRARGRCGRGDARGWSGARRRLEHPDFRAGAHVVGTFGVQDYAISDGRGVIRVAGDSAPLVQYLSALGMRA